MQVTALSDSDLSESGTGNREIPCESPARKATTPIVLGKYKNPNIHVNSSILSMLVTLYIQGKHDDRETSLCDS